jgi:adenylate cyclase
MLAAMAVPELPQPTLKAWEREWRAHGKKLHSLRRVMKRLPTEPRCKICYAPFSGLGSRVVRPFGYRQSRKNPNMCSVCIEDSPEGGAEMEGGVLFADVRGFTTLAETRSPADVAALLNRFYKATTDALIHHDGVIDKLVGDEVMGLFLPPLVSGDAREQMVRAAEKLLKALGFGSGEEPLLPVGVGLEFGRLFVGNVGGGGDVRDFTALGDAVNTASRLQSAAGPGQIVMSERVYEAVAEGYPDAEPVELELKGKAAQVTARIVEIGRPLATTAV